MRSSAYAGLIGCFGGAIAGLTGIGIESRAIVRFRRSLFRREASITKNNNFHEGKKNRGGRLASSAITFSFRYCFFMLFFFGAGLAVFFLASPSLPPISVKLSVVLKGN
jgi:hypothetical protein